MKYKLIDVTGKQGKSIGTFDFETQPHVGEYVEIDEDTMPICRQVVQVIHTQRGCDVFVKQPQSRVVVLKEVLDTFG